MAMDVKKVFGSNLKKYRKTLKYTQEDLAEKMGITPQHLSLIETGVTFVSAEIIEKASVFLKVSYASLFYNQEEIDGSKNFMSKIDNIIHEEIINAEKNIRNRIRG